MKNEDPCLLIRSPAGEWRLVRNEKDREEYEKEGDERKAVLSRNELSVALPILKKMQKDEIQAWLADIILIKKTIGGIIKSVSNGKNHTHTRSTGLR